MNLVNILYRITIGEKLHVSNPKTFSEKIQWKKLYDHNPLYTILVDKYKVREYVKDIIGEEYLIPLLGVWDSFEQIDFSTLPNQFVLKCNHDLGGFCLCEDKKFFNIKKARHKINKSLQREFNYALEGWAYKDVPRKIIAEQYLREPGKVVPDKYKIFCFNGKPKYICVYHERFDNKGASCTAYDVEWNKINISFNKHYSISDKVQEKPKCLGELLTICKKISKNHAVVGVDFYIVKNKIYFSEINLYSEGGLARITPRQLDLKLGDMIDLEYKGIFYDEY